MSGRNGKPAVRGYAASRRKALRPVGARPNGERSVGSGLEFLFVEVDGARFVAKRAVDGDGGVAEVVVGVNQLYFADPAPAYTGSYWLRGGCQGGKMVA